MNQPYQGAYSRRRFSNFEIGTSDPIDNPGSFKTLSVHWDPSMGKVTGSGNFNANGSGFGLATAAPGDTITLTAYPEKGYHFVHWGGAVSAKNTNNPIDIKMNTSADVKAVFAKDPDIPSPPPGGGDPDTPLDPGTGGNGGNGGNVFTFLGVYPKAGESNLKAFIRQYWWAILIVAYIVYKEWKGAKQ